MAESFLEEQLKRIKEMTEQISRVRTFYRRSGCTCRSLPRESRRRHISRRRPAVLARVLHGGAIASPRHGRAGLRRRRGIVGLLVVVGMRASPAAISILRASPSFPAASCQPSADAAPPGSQPSDPNSRFRLSRWCETVGPVFFQVASRRGAPNRSTTLAIVSWNIHEGRGRRRRPDSAASWRRVHRRRADRSLRAPASGSHATRARRAAARSTRLPGAAPHRAQPSRPDGDIRRFAEEGSRCCTRRR